jgi:hypothetical protein
VFGAKRVFSPTTVIYEGAACQALNFTSNGAARHRFRVHFQQPDRG